ncbi:hypothetical protein BT67DRAFT_120589 [Trichocladium antarcticum]|uniref:Uncharacterized protein n=1 Tax=Trichocladium antarcticum TaxID=1450529 RepID=A0AAN6URL6_9PEZI|nr:hypothetical protein BT67DRAFT_120589 [Trichocladium antarcticum]
MAATNAIPGSGVWGKAAATVWWVGFHTTSCKYVVAYTYVRVRMLRTAGISTWSVCWFVPGQAGCFQSVKPCLRAVSEPSGRTSARIVAERWQVVIIRTSHIYIPSPPSTRRLQVNALFGFLTASCRNQNDRHAQCTCSS